MGRARGLQPVRTVASNRRLTPVDRLALRLLADHDKAAAMRAVERHLRSARARLAEPSEQVLLNLYLDALVAHETVEGTITNAARMMLFEFGAPGARSERLVTEPLGSRVAEHAVTYHILADGEDGDEPTMCGRQRRADWTPAPRGSFGQALADAGGLSGAGACRACATAGAGLPDAEERLDDLPVLKPGELDDIRAQVSTRLAAFLRRTPDASHRAISAVSLTTLGAALEEFARRRTAEPPPQAGSLLRDALLQRQTISAR